MDSAPPAQTNGKMQVYIPTITFLRHISYKCEIIIYKYVIPYRCRY